MRVSDPIDRFFEGVPPTKRGITVRHLLTHTAGLVEALGDDYEPVTRRAMIAAALTSELRSRPGARYHYSNVGYSLLAAIIEKASGLEYEDYLAQELFAPAAMTHTGYVLPDWDPDGWVVADTALGQVTWHNGGNGWAYAELSRLPESGAGLFWVTNHYRSAAGGWDLDRLRPSLTEQVAERLVLRPASAAG